MLALAFVLRSMSKTKHDHQIARTEISVDSFWIARALVVGDCSSFRQAARLLGIQQSVLSRGVQALEDNLGVSLFERYRGGVRVTNAGAHFLMQAREALNQLEKAVVSAAKAGSGTIGYLNIGIMSSIAVGYLHNLIEKYACEHPEIVIQLREGAGRGHVEAVRSRQLDVAFVRDSVEAAECEVDTLWMERIFVALPKEHPLRDREDINLNDIQNERLIVCQPEGDAAFCRQITQFVTHRNRAVNVETFDVGRETLMQLVALGQGVALTSEATAGNLFPGIVFRPIAEVEGNVRFCAIWSSQNDNPALRRFLSLARTLARQSENALQLT